jgi:hypothetical protein
MISFLSVIKKMQSIQRKADMLIQNVLAKCNNEQTLQTTIHPEISFKYNSINLLVARRGVGKTFNVMKELIILSQLPDNGGYTTFLYVSDKTNDTTVNELIKLIKLKVRQVSYQDVLKVMEDIIDAKSALEDAIRKDLVDHLSEKTVKDLKSTLDLSNISVAEIPHTAILLDDAINILKDPKNKKLMNLLFQNRQPRFTIFICVQDVFGLPPNIKRNCDAVWIFAGLTDKHAFGMMCRQLGLDDDVDRIWQKYKQLEYRDVMIINYTTNGTEIDVRCE